MAMTLDGSPKFKKEFNDYKEKISKITNEDFRSELEEYLRKLVIEVKNLDIMHGELSMHRELPNGVLDSRNSIVSLRKTLDKKLESWERAQNA
jgi:predicted nuclease with TOPRIM domain